MNPERQFLNFHFRGHLPPKSEIESRSNRHFTQSSHGMHCKEVLLGVSNIASTFLYDVMFAELRGVKFAKFPNFGSFCPYKTPKHTFRWPALYTAQGLHRRMTTIFPCGSRRSKGVPSGRVVFLWLLVGGGVETPKLAQIFAYGKWLYPYRIGLLIHGASDLDHKCLKTRNSEDGCTFPPNIFAPTPKITPKPHFGGPFNAKPIIQRVSISRTLMDLRSWNFTVI